MVASRSLLTSQSLRRPPRKPGLFAYRHKRHRRDRLRGGGRRIRTIGPSCNKRVVLVETRGLLKGADDRDRQNSSPSRAELGGSNPSLSTGESTANLISLPGASPAHILRKRRTIGDDRGARVLQEADLPEGGARGSLGRWRRGSLQDRVRLVGRRLQIGAGTPSPCRSSSGWITPASPDAP